MFVSAVRRKPIEVTAASVAVPPNIEWNNVWLNPSARSAWIWDVWTDMFWAEDVSSMRVLSTRLGRPEGRIQRR
ncbi:unnamed protein product [Lasius platythorax]|uniref:Uncharacterized protein n=1 Tax=Lasius platythorax TaxID=488582 RepID=A0AAV2NMK4_9HYME